MENPANLDQSRFFSHEVILAIRHPDGRAVEEATIAPGDILLVDAWLVNIRVSLR